MARRINDSRDPIRSSRRRLDNNNEDHAWGPWTNLPWDILMVILMRLGLIDFLAFSGICRPWRSFALSIREAFLAQKEPLLLTLSKRATLSQRACTLIDIFNEGRRYKTLLPHISRGSCVGVSCGYVILLSRNPSKFSLVNPITRHELHFPALPKNMPFFTSLFRAILVYSSLLSKFVIVVLFRRNNSVLFSGSGDSKWVVLPNPGADWDIVDLTFFKGKIYMLNDDGSVGKMRLNPLPSLQLLGVKSIPSSHSFSRELVTSSDRLFLVESLWSRTDVKHELNFEKMEWVEREDLGEDTLFISSFKCSSVVNSTNWQGRGKAHCNSTYTLTRKEANAWYFPHECYNNNLLEELQM